MSESLTDFQSWPRIKEIEEYAEYRDISIQEAILELVNAGLSHWRRD